jgi:hypothetical protein
MFALSFNPTQPVMLYDLCLDIYELLNNTQNTKNLISGQEEKIAWKESSCLTNGEATFGKHTSIKNGAYLFLLQA